jgi:hypothetical protein
VYGGTSFVRSLRFHAVALAIAGWYLMAPIPGHDSIPDPVVTFSNWITVRSFDSAEGCEEVRVDVIRAGVGGAEFAGYPEQEVRKVLTLSQCIASDDPRLKGE